ncbi:MAG TPA: hypothetical protein VFC33_16740 [Acidimicrobiia bacterium]|nr:hypothetical protein [Acidimicrobiia bacterium]
MATIFGAGVPDFARRYPPCPLHGYDGEPPDVDACDGELDEAAGLGWVRCAGCAQLALLPPRRAYALWAAASHYLAAMREVLERADDDEAELADAVAGQVELPPIVLRYLQPAWVARFSACFDAYRELLAAGRGTTPPECTGETMALHLMLAWAHVFVSHGFWRTSDAYRRLPETPYDGDFTFLEEALVDEDVLLLFDERLADCDDPDRLLASFEVRNLNPARWFLPFEVQADAA